MVDGMITTIVALAADILGDVLIHYVDHPDLAAKLVKTVRESLMTAHDAEKDPEEIKRERMTALAAGLAAERSNARQAAIRRAMAKP